MSDSMNHWLDAAGRYPLLSTEETLELARKVQSTEGKQRTKAINKLCEHNLRLVVNVVKQVVKKRVDIRMGDERCMDFLQLGYFGLRRAVEKFDPARGYKFSTYAVPWIRQAIQRFSMSDSLIYIPEATLREVHHRLMNGGKESGHAGATVNPEVIAAGIRAASVGSIDIRVGEDEDNTLSDALSAENAVSYVYEGRSATDLLRKKMTEAGIDEASQELMVWYAKRGRISIAAVKANYNRKTAGARIKEVTAILQSQA